MQVKTITTAAGVNEIDFGNDNSQSTAHFYWLKNLGDSALYVSANPNPVAEKDDVAELPAKGAVSVETDEGKIYVLGAGKVEIHRTNSKFCPFDWQSSGSGGGGGSITVDSELSDTSTNPLQNKVTTAAINEVNSALETKSDINHIHDISASGNPVVMNNLQRDVPFSEMVVSGKNLLSAMSNSVTQNGITYTVNADGMITLNGTAEKADSVDVITKTPLKAGVYTLTGCPEGGSGTSFALRAGLGAANTLYGRDYGNGLKITTETDTVITVTIQNAEIGRVFDNLVFRPQLEIGDIPTDYEPPITGRELTVEVSGKNLLKYPYYNTTQTQNGVTFTSNGDGSITVNGTATATAYFSLSSVKALPTGKYVLGKSMGNILLYVDKYLDNAFYQRLATSTETIKELIFNVSEDDAQKYTYKFGIQINKDNTVDNVTVYPQLELGGTATDYEPYHGSTTTITPDSNPYTVPNDIRQQEGYNVISVSEGELSVVGVQKNAAIKRIWDDMNMDLLFDGVTSADNPALIDIKGYSNIVVSVTSKYSDDTINTGTIIMAVSDIIKSISVGIKRYFSTGSRASIINITGTINNCAIVLELYNTGDTILNCKIYGNK